MCGAKNSAKHGIESLKIRSGYEWWIWGFPKIGIPQNGWFTMGKPIKMEDLGVPLFLETPIWISIPSFFWMFLGHCKSQEEWQPPVFLGLAWAPLRSSHTTHATTTPSDNAAGGNPTGRPEPPKMVVAKEAKSLIYFREIYIGWWKIIIWPDTSKILQSYWWVVFRCHTGD